jgi:hypothetical protein
MPTLLAYRDYSGLGDWIMAVAVLKMVNHQYPDMDIFIHRRNTTPLIRDIVEHSGLRFAGWRSGRWRRDEFDHVSGHMLYAEIFRETRRGRVLERHFIEDMVLTFNQYTGLDLCYEADTFCTFTGAEEPVDVPADYILMVSSGKRWMYTGGKDWRRRRFRALAERLALHLPVVQIGAAGDPPLPAARHHYLGPPLASLHFLMRRSRFFVGLDNGLSHWAGHHGFPTFTIFCGRFEHPVHSAYPGQIPVVARDVAAVYEAIRAGAELPMPVSKN